MKTTRIMLMTAIIPVFLFSCSNSGQTKKNTPDNCILYLYAAAGTRLVSDEISNLFEKKTACLVQRNYASSGILAKQIESGAECDVFVSADKQWIDYLADKGLLVEGSIHKVAGNSLVVVAPIGSHVKAPQFKADFDILAVIPNKIAIGDPSFVPVGKYTKQVFDSLKWFEAVKNKTIMGKDVTAVLQYAEMGECDWAIVYYSEAILSDKIKIIAQIPRDLHDTIAFYVADINGQKQKGHDLSIMFIDTTAQSVFLNHGFQLITTAK